MKQGGKRAQNIIIYFVQNIKLAKEFLSKTWPLTELTVITDTMY